MALTRITGTVIKDGGLQNDDLPDSGVTANSYGSGTAIPVLTVNSKGIVTSVTTTSVAGVSSLSWDTGTEVLTLSTADGGSYTADLSGMASQGYVDTAINNLIASAPGTLDTLDELAAALGDDANFASTVTTSLAGKVDKINITGTTVGSASQVPVITFNSQGQITSATSTAVAGVSALSYNQSTGVLTIDTADGGQFTTDIIVGQDDQPEFTNIFINDTGSTVRGIARTDAAYSLNLMGGADVTDGARIQLNGGQRGGNGSANNASIEFYTGSDYAASQSAVVGDYYFKTQYGTTAKTLMQIDSSTGYVGINTVGAPTGTLDVNGNIVVTGTVDGRDLSADGTKLDGIEVGATADQTKADIDALGIDADTLDGQHGSYYTSYADTAVSTAITNLIDGAPVAFDTLKELSDGLTAVVKDTHLLIPSITTLERDAISASPGMLIYNSDVGVLQQYIGENAWVSIAPSAAITSVTLPGSQTAVLQGDTVVITGISFDSNPSVAFVDSGNNTYSAASISRISSSRIDATLPSLSEGTYAVKVTNSNGTAAQFDNAFDVDGTPVFNSSSGSLGSLLDYEGTANFDVGAIEDGSAVNVSITSGALPTGLSINSTGTITGTPSAGVSSDTTYNFTVTATDSENQTSSRSFSITVIENYQVTSSIQFQG